MPSTPRRASRADAACAATIYDKGILLVAENPSLDAAQDLGDLRPDRLRRRRQVQRVRPASRRRRTPRRHQGVRLQPRGRRRAVAGEPLRPVPRQRLHPRDEADGGGDPRRRAGRRPRRAAAVPDRLRGHDHRRGRVRGARRRRRRDPGAGLPRAHGPTGRSPRRFATPSPRSPARIGRSDATDLEVAVLSDVGAATDVPSPRGRRGRGAPAGLIRHAAIAPLRSDRWSTASSGSRASSASPSRTAASAA